MHPIDSLLSRNLYNMLYSPSERFFRGKYKGRSLILVINSFSSEPDENYLVVMIRFFAILKSPNHFKIIIIIAN